MKREDSKVKLELGKKSSELNSFRTLKHGKTCEYVLKLFGVREHESSAEKMDEKKELSNSREGKKKRKKMKNKERDWEIESENYK